MKPARTDRRFRADKSDVVMSMRLRMATVEGIAAAAKAAGVTQKQIIVDALRDAGVTVDAADLQDHTPRRRSAHG
jgi:hypothetical protein